MLAFRNGFDYRNFDSKRFNGNILSTYCANLIKILFRSKYFSM